MRNDARVVLVGFGNMGRALARGWLGRGLPPEGLQTVDPDAAARDAAARLGVASTASCAGVRPPVDVAVLAVKPDRLADALRDCAGWRDRGGGPPVFLSIVAGKTLGQMLAVLGAPAAVVRAMPNTPAAIGKGMTVLTASSAVSPAQRALCTELAGAVGDVAWVEDERLMDAVTAVSGSGPAYVFLLIESLERAAMAEGLSPALARRLATATVAGAGAYAESSGQPAAELRRQVTSPGGTTAAALERLLAEDGMPALLERAVRAAARRSRELAGG